MNYLTKSSYLRKKILQSVYSGGGGHIGGCFSIIDFLIYAYNSFLNIDPKNPNESSRDKLILSKGHCSLALYWVLSDKGFFSADLIDSYGQDGARFAGHPELGKAPGIEASTGSLGHGPSIGVGMALGAIKSGLTEVKTLVICGDGELNEGSVWEAILCAAQLKLTNYYIIIDNNKLESLDLTNNIISIEPLKDKMESFGFLVERIDGHDFDAIGHALKNLSESVEIKPKCLILDTYKGKGVSFIEMVPKWHFRAPTEDEYNLALAELNKQESLNEK